ncbi:methyl-accepting chemotaxis protein [Aestuariibacter sp. GS-14]|uniref:methyl-accepting chemotaxis protein n=1 Tax=Aestuariibacter sp. GS-14 TaxID=2590670 RepID=UPI00112A62E4|nr:methyl-accepting chemotaxis protein [Aestuariibacter sp. GS-14]TPV61724.1 methyl-accepting chemotaxis protein [Aestuariibacter sp. GS-14]
MTLKQRLLFSLIPLVIFVVLLMAGISLHISVNESREALTLGAEKKLMVEVAQTHESVSQYLNFIERQLQLKSTEALVIEASKQFANAYRRYDAERNPLQSNESQMLQRYYDTEFANLYSKRNGTNISNPLSLVNGLSDTAKKLQYDFIAGSRFPIGEKDTLFKPNNTSEYAAVHEKYHGFFRAFLKEFGFYDIFIADPKTGDVVYSVFKELDYATNLQTGPYAKTGIAEAYRKALNNKDKVSFSKLESYLPSYNAMAGFLGAQIIDENGTTTGVLIFQIPLNVISNILEHNQQWQEIGYGDSGETYLVSADKKLVTESRFFLEAPNDYLAAVGRLYPKTAKQVADAGTTVGIQDVDTVSVERALNGQKGFGIVKDYRDVEVFSAYRQLSIGDNQYALIAEIDVEEALQPAVVLRNKLVTTVFIAIAIIVALSVVVIVWLSGRLVRPLTRLGDACEQLASGNGDLTVKLAETRIAEINRIVLAFNQFTGQIRDIIDSVKGASESLASASEELSAITHQSETTTDNQARQMQEVASAITQLTDSITSIAESTSETRDFGTRAEHSLNENMERADMAADNIKLLVKLIQDSSTIIASLKAEVSQITSLLNVIKSIADQTNLLALNAAIEAARAGEAGRGFSVVADEVRTLANRSQESTVEIERIIEKMNVSSEKSVVAMEKAEAAAGGGIHLVDLVTVAMNELGQTIEQVQQLVSVVASAAVEQEATSNAIGENVNEVNHLSEDIHNGAVHTRNAADELAKIAVSLQDMVNRFKT